MILIQHDTAHQSIWMGGPLSGSGGALWSGRAPLFAFGAALEIEIPLPTPEPKPVFTVPPDFIFPAAIVGDDIRPSLCPESSTLPQRVVKLLLDGGVLHYGAHPEGIRRALPFLESPEYTTFSEMIARQQPSVVHNYPRIGATMPTMAIVVGDERIALDEKLMYDFAAVCVDQYGDVQRKPIDTFSVGFDSSLSVMVYTEHPDTTIFWYEVAKFVLQQARLLLAKVGIDNPRLSGRDLYPDPTFLPETLYVRQLNLSFRTRQVYAEEAPLIAHVESFVQTNVQVTAPPR